MKLGHRVQNCKACQAGSYAPRIHELTHFEEFPRQFGRSCNIAIPSGDPSDCDVFTGWHVNQDQMLDSGSRGLPPGLKFSFKSVIRYQNILGGKMQAEDATELKALFSKK